MNIEFQILDALQGIHTPLLDKFMVAVTNLGNAGMIWIALTALCLLIPKTRKLGLTMALSLIIEACCCNLILKPLVARVRPFDVNTAVALLVAPPQDFSFPSGHTGASFAVVSALLFSKSRYWLLALLLASLIAFSRLYLYVHYPSDVFTAMVIGILSGWLSRKLLCRFSEMKKAK